MVLALTLPMLLRDGMFMDAMLYTAVSHNEAHDIGSFWFPVFSQHGVAGLSTFHEQPPLGFWIQSLFFRVLGDSMYTERIYTLCMILLTLFIMGKWWNKMSELKLVAPGMQWISWIFWMSIPVCFWSYQQNQHENTMTLFILLAGYFLFLAMEEKNKVWFHVILGGIMVMLATLTKGIPGLFPLGIPMIHWMIFRKTSFWKMMGFSLLATLVVGMIYLMFILFSETARESLHIYFVDRALKRIESLPTVDSHFYIIGRLALELIVPAVLTIILYFSFRKQQMERKKSSFSYFLFFFLVGLSGSLPLMITLVQKGFYFVPSLPFFAIAFALLINENLAKWITSLSEKAGKRIFVFSAVLLLSVLTVSFLQIGKYARDEEVLQDVATIGKLIPEHETVGMDEDLWNDWRLQTYLMRYHFIHCDTKTDHQYYIRPNTRPAAPDSSFVQADVPMKAYLLYQKK